MKTHANRPSVATLAPFAAVLVAVGVSWVGAQTTTFEGFAPGSVNYQGSGVTTTTPGGYSVPSPYGSLWTVADEWGFTGNFDQAVINDGTGNMVWRLSNALTSSGYSNQPFTPSSPLPAGESTSALYNSRGDNHTVPLNPPNPRASAATPYFHGSFKFKSATGASQPGLSMTMSPMPRQSNSRMSYLNILDTGSGFNLMFYDTLPAGAFPPSGTIVASGLSYSNWHQVDMYIKFADGLNPGGSGNDLVHVLLDGNLVHTGTTWETYFVAFPGSLTPPIAVDSMTFRVAGTAVPANSGNGFFFDDVTADNAPAPDSVYPVQNLTQNTGHLTIQAAINAANSGDTITVAPGTYTEDIGISRGITLLGANAGIDPNTGTRHPESIVDGPVGSHIRISTTEPVRVDGFTLNGLNLDSYTADSQITYQYNKIANLPGNMFFNAPDTFALKYNHIYGTAADWDALLLAGDWNGTTGTTVTIQGNVMDNAATAAGLNLSSVTGTISGNTFDGIAYYGLLLANDTNVEVDHNLFHGMINPNPAASATWGAGVRTYTPGPNFGMNVHDNTFSDNYVGIGIRPGSVLTGRPVTVASNIFSDNTTALNNSSVDTVSATYNYWGNEDGPTGVSNGVSGTVIFSPWWADSALTILRDGLVDDIVITTPQTYGDLYIAPGTTVTVTPEGSLAADKVELADGAEITVNGGELDLGQGSVISGTFTIFNSFGSWDINGDTTFNIGQSLALISDIHVAAGKTVTVNGGGELILDGCIMDSQTPGTPYNFTAATDGLLTLARCVVTDANIDINTTLAGNLRSRVYDNRFITSDIEAAPAAKVYHNLLDAATDAAKNTDATTAFDAIDGWANVTSAGALQNKFTLDFEAPVAVGRTLDAAGNLFVQPADAVVVKMDVAALGTNTITAAEALLGYNSGMLTLAGTPTRVTPLGDWEVIAETAPAPSGLGIVDSALGLQLDAGEEGISADSQIARVNFTAGSPGLTLGFFRVQTDGLFNPDGTLVKDTRLTKSTAGLPSLLEAFTANTGELVIDNQLPAIATTGQTGTQVQPTNGTVDVLNPANYVIRDGTPVMLSFTATDAGLAGLDAPDATADLALTAYNGTTTLGAADYTVTAVEAAGVVTYTVTLNVPATATTGTYVVTATVRDRSGNVSPLATLGSFQIANEVLATVELEAYAGGTRQVVFSATDGSGTELKRWTKNVVFTGTTGAVPLEAVPTGTAAISAKTAWNLRSKLAVAFSGVGVGAVSLTGTDKLPGGDITGDNVVNTLDYSVLRYHWLTNDAVANINGDTIVNLADYGLLKGNFYTIGDPQ